MLASALADSCAGRASILSRFQRAMSQAHFNRLHSRCYNTYASNYVCIMVYVGWLFRGEAKSPKNTEKGGNQCEVSCLRFLPIHLNEDKPDR